MKLLLMDRNFLLLLSTADNCIDPTSIDVLFIQLTVVYVIITTMFLMSLNSSSSRDSTFTIYYYQTGFRDFVVNKYHHHSSTFYSYSLLLCLCLVLSCEAVPQIYLQYSNSSATKPETELIVIKAKKWVSLCGIYLSLFYKANLCLCPEKAIRILLYASDCHPNVVCARQGSLSTLLKN